MERFLKAQQEMYATALSEIKAGKKRSHYMWYIFPQLRGLGQSQKSNYYGIDGLAEARAYLKQPILSARLMEITVALLEHTDKEARDIFGDDDAMKLHSSMTLFAVISNEFSVFHRVLDKFFERQMDEETLNLIRKEIEIEPQQYFKSLYKQTEDGKMPIVYFPYDGQQPYEHIHYVTWSADEALALEEEYMRLLEALRHLAPKQDDLVKNSKQRESLSQEEQCVLETYLLPFGEYEVDSELLAELYDRSWNDDTLTDEEHEILECHYEWKKQQASKRLPQKSYTSLHFINMARGYAKAIQLNAPQCVVDEKARWLALEMILYHYGIYK